MKNIAIIGAGASGLFLSKKLSQHDDLQIYVFEKCKNVGTKLRASGGGKANIFNQHITPDGYNHPDFVEQLLQQVSPAQLQHEFEQMGMAVMADEEGRAYPISQFSQTVVDTLWQPDEPNIHAELEFEVRQLNQCNEQWRINDYPVLFDKVIIASGSPANMILKNRKGYNDFLTPFNLKSQSLQPSLVGFTIDQYPKSLSGCRTKVMASLWQNDYLIHEEFGEVTFKDDGISGIVILNLSAYYNRLPSKENCHLQLNFIYHDSDFDVEAHLSKFHSLKGILHPKLNDWYEKHSFDVKKCKFAISGTYDLDFAQVCHGGVDLSEVNDHFELVRFPGLYITGELLDIDGVCGGYNLFFAFATSMIVAKSLTC